MSIRDVGPTLVYCWSTVYEVGPTVSKLWPNVSCLLGMIPPNNQRYTSTILLTHNEYSKCIFSSTYGPAGPDGSFISTRACNLEVPGSNSGRAGYCHRGCAYTVLQTVQSMECTVMPIVLCTIKNHRGHSK